MSVVATIASKNNSIINNSSRSGMKRSLSPSNTAHQLPLKKPSNHASPLKKNPLGRGGIIVKKKPIQAPPVVSPTLKKAKTTSTGTSSSISATSADPSFDLEVTICPICDEACTCPKTVNNVNKNIASSASKVPIGAPSVSNKKSKSKSRANLKKIPNKKSSKKLSSSKGKEIKYFEEEGHDEEEADYESDSNYYSDYSSSIEADRLEHGHLESDGEDPALSFIRMIYSDEESLDEEEAYALYQATQLFSSSSEEEEDFYFYNQIEDQEDYEYEEADEMDYEDNEGDADSSATSDFEYTVVEYVQQKPSSHMSSTNSSAASTVPAASKVNFVAYSSENEDEALGNDAKTAAPSSSADSTSKSSKMASSAQPATADGCSNDGEEVEEGSESWMTWSVFDVSGDDQAISFNISSASSLLSSQGAAEPTTTLLFSTNGSMTSAEKIPNIAPQVLAAISTAAKMMASQQNSSNHNSNTKYFSYITMKGAGGGNCVESNHSSIRSLDDDEFLFFEEEEAAAFCETDIDTYSDEEDVDTDNDAFAEAEHLDEEDIICNVEQLEITDYSSLDEDEELIDEAEEVIFDAVTRTARKYEYGYCNSPSVAFPAIEESDASSFSDDSTIPLIASSKTASLKGNNSASKLKSKSKLKSRKTNAAPSVVPSVAASTAASSFDFDLDRWKRVPINTFRRSRRPSLPPVYLHPQSAALKSSAAFSNVTLTESLLDFTDSTHQTTSATVAAATANTVQHDSYVPNSPSNIPRAYSAITLDELNFDIVKNSSNSSMNSNPSSYISSHHSNSSPAMPIPIKKSSNRSAANGLFNSNPATSYEWLNNAWQHWE